MIKGPRVTDNTAQEVSYILQIERRLCEDGFEMASMPSHMHKIYDNIHYIASTDLGGA